MTRPFNSVLIVGAGPAGLLLALLLSKKGIQCHILEASHELDQQPRAAVYGGAAIPELARAGVIDRIRAEGFSLRNMAWRSPADHSAIATLDCSVMASVNGLDLRAACLGLHELDELLLDEFLTKYDGRISWKTRVVDVGQDDQTAWVHAATEAGEVKYEADYVVGADGATSAVRKALFGDEFPGFTWDRQIVATNVYYDFAGKFGWNDTNFVLHPTDFFMACRISNDGLYRVTYGEQVGLSRDEIIARQPARFQALLPGHPTPDQYQLTNISPYKMHQRCAPKFREGRVLLVADAAHVCNPWGGLGITGGFVDVGGLYDCLAGIWDGLADESILDVYSEKRIEKYKTIIDVVSQDNFRRVADEDPLTLFGRDEFLQTVKKAETDAVLSKELQMSFNGVRYDFTQHYKQTA